jgi:hypothetical protein
VANRKEEVYFLNNFELIFCYFVSFSYQQNEPFVIWFTNCGFYVLQVIWGGSVGLPSGAWKMQYADVLIEILILNAQFLISSFVFICSNCIQTEHKFACNRTSGGFEVLQNHSFGSSLK